MNSEESFSIALAVSVYVFGVLFVVLWGYMTTKLTFLMVNENKPFLRIVCWLFVGWGLAIGLYLIFLIGGGLIALGLESINELIE